MSKASIGERKAAKCMRIAREWKAAHKDAHRYRPGSRVDERTRRAYAKMHKAGKLYYKSGCGTVLDLFPAVIDGAGTWSRKRR